MGPNPLGDPQRTGAAGSSPPDATTHYKVCPRCGTPAQLHAMECPNLQCRRPYRTQFAEPARAEPTIAYPAPPASGNTAAAYPPAASRVGSPSSGSAPGPSRAVLVTALVVLVAGFLGVGIMIIQALRPPTAATTPMPAVSGESQAGTAPPTTPSAPSEVPTAPDTAAAAPPPPANNPGADGTALNAPAVAPEGSPQPGLPPPVASLANGPTDVPTGMNAPAAGDPIAGDPSPPRSEPAPARPPETGLPPSTLLPSGAAFVGGTRPTLPCGHAIGQTLVQPEDRIERAFCERGDMFVRKGKRWVRP